MDRPIIFSASMVRALIAGRKTQTRRLASSPLKRCAVGDRLYVREAWSHSGDGVFEIFQARLLGRGGVIYRADDNSRYPHAKFWPSLHMPREFSRLTLVIEGVKVEPLQACSEADAIAEGLTPAPMANDMRWKSSEDGRLLYDRAAVAYAELWGSLHTKPGERWQDNPDVVALTFRVVTGNIDRLAA